jgi:hypothetical protein
MLDGLAMWLLANMSPRSETLCSENVEIIQQNLTNSVEKCCPEETAANRYLPARLLDLGTEAQPASRLISTEALLRAGTTSNIQYAALSYCWGPIEDAKQNLKTETASIEQFLEFVNPDLFPPVIRDTVEVCRALNIRYMWADTLCIIQDDDLDWSQESQSMGLVYLNAYITICPLSSSSCLQGFLERSARTISVPFHSTLDDSIQGIFDLEYQPTVTKPTEDIDIAQDIVNSRWQTRGWTLQELYMSRRILYFGWTRFHFQCAHEGFSEDAGSIKYSFIEPLPEFVKDAEAQPSSLYEKWYQIGAHYCLRSLTKVDDKLPAISGLASFFGQHIGDEYVVGLWRGDLIRGLVWCNTTNRKPEKEHMQHLLSSRPANIPSWSWLAHGSFDWGLAEVPQYDMDIISECVITPHIELAGPNPFGQINHAALEVFGKYISCPVLHRVPRDGFNHPAWDIEFEGRRIFLCELDFDQSSPKYLPPPGTILLKLSICYEYIHVSKNTSRSPAEAVWGVILVPTETAEVYYRIGIFGSHPSARRSIDIFRTVECRTIHIL